MDDINVFVDILTIMEAPIVGVRLVSFLLFRVKGKVTFVNVNVRRIIGVFLIIDVFVFTPVLGCDIIIFRRSVTVAGILVTIVVPDINRGRGLTAANVIFLGVPHGTIVLDVRNIRVGIIEIETIVP